MLGNKNNINYNEDLLGKPLKPFQSKLGITGGLSDVITYRKKPPPESSESQTDGNTLLPGGIYENKN